MGAVNTMRVFGELAQLNPQAIQSLENVDYDKLFQEIWFANSSILKDFKDPRKRDSKSNLKAGALNNSKLYKVLLAKEKLQKKNL